MLHTKFFCEFFSLTIFKDKIGWREAASSAIKTSFPGIKDVYQADGTYFLFKQSFSVTYFFNLTITE